MSKFLTPLRTEKVGPQRWLLFDDLVYQTDILNGQFTVPRGFQTDFASIPRALWTFLPKEDLYDAAAVIHDAAYAGALISYSHRVYLIKEWADKLFLEAMVSCGVSNWRARIMYFAVKEFGDPSYHPLKENARMKDN